MPPAAPCPLQHGWTVQGSNIMFQPQAEAGATKELPSIELINNALVYAKELERIV
jgi:26S proteasome regulatory subunit N12